MIKLKRYPPAVLLVGVILVTTSKSQPNSRQQRELRMANQAILASLSVSRSPAGKKLCVENKLACVGPDKAELGLTLIGARNTKESRLALTELLGYRLDGSVAEDYRCYVLKPGPAMKPQLIDASPEQLSKRCTAELQTLIRSRSESFKGLDENAVCADPESIRLKLKELIEAVNKGLKCNAEDF
jgi:hypothetical protein